MSMMSQLKKHILNIIYPENICCISCDKDLGINETYRYGLCNACEAQITWITGRTCRACGGPLPIEHDSEICYNCEKVESVLIRCEACYGYSGLGKDLIMDLKYKRKTHLGKYLARMMADVVKTTLIDDVDLIVSVPLHKKRLNERGFNQMDVIGEALSVDLSMPYENSAITRTKNTPKMKTLDRQDRKHAINALFDANPDLVLGKRILLIDDIYTTGSTMNACAKSLLSAGALTVHGAVLSVNFRD